jgi:hypothetical protein
VIETIGTSSQGCLFCVCSNTSLTGPTLPANRPQIEREKLTIRHMIEIYCRGQRPSATGICEDCGEVIRYAHDRIGECPYVAQSKPACGLCRSNCFTPEMHRRFALIMRYAGPRMMVRHPILTVAHIWDAVKGNRNRKSKTNINCTFSCNVVG